MRAALLVAMFIIISAPAMAEQVIINSQDWRDVYSGAQYGAVNGFPVHFSIDDEQTARMLEGISDEDIILITGRQQAFPGLRALLQSRGYSIDEMDSRDAIDFNQELAMIAPTRNVVVIDDAYGYNAISVATYARLKNASVLFADPGIIDVIEEKNPEEILLYGHIPTDMYDELLVYEPVIINEQDKFSDNFALVKRFTGIAPRESIILTNGEFVETQLMTDQYPTLFVGRQNVPEEVLDFIRDSEFRIAVLVGNALAPNAKFIKDETGVAIFIKFAQGRDQEQFGLDLFPVPVPRPEITIGQAEYDASQQSLLITYENPSDIATYFTASFETPEGTIEDIEPVFLEAGSHKTIRYSSPAPGETLTYTLLYGSSLKNLELLLRGNVSVTQVTIQDSSEISINKASYRTDAGEFIVSVENNGSVDAYVLLEARDVRIGGERVRVASPVQRVRAGRTIEMIIPARLSERDIARNSELSLEAFYGQREFSLVKSVRATVPFDVETGGFPISYVALAVVVALILIWLVGRRTRRRAPY